MPNDEWTPQKDFFRDRETPERRNRPWVCVVRLGSIGDNLIATSVLPLLARSYKVEVMAQEPAHVIFENNPYVDKLTIKKGGDLPATGGIDWQEWFAARSREYAKFVHLSHSCEVSLALVRAQTQFWWSDDMRRRICGRSYLEFAHDIAGVEYEFNPRFYPTSEEINKAVETKKVIGSPCIGWCISGSRIDKIWPPAPIAIARIIKETGVPVVMFGSPGKDFEIAKQIMEHVERANSTVAGLHLALSPDPEKPTWPIRRSLTQLQGCDLVVTPDSGLAWSVARERMPKIVLLSHASQENITKHWYDTTTLHADPGRVPCWPCHRLHDSIETCKPNETNSGAACISDISTEVLVQTVKNLLSRGMVMETEDTGFVNA